MSRPPCGLSVEPALFSYFLAIYLLYSVFHPLVFSKVCQAHLASLTDPGLTCTNIGQLNTTAAQDASQRINEDTNFWIKVSSISATLPSLLGDILIGSWSDTFSRRLPLLLPSVGGLLATCIYLALLNIPSMGVAWLCAASLLSGIFGGYTGVIAASFAYISEVVEPTSRSWRVALAEGCVFLAATVGPFLSAALSSLFGNMAVFCLHGICHLTNLLYCLWLPEPRLLEPASVSLSSLFSLR